jgi:hypothetical protein
MAKDKDTPKKEKKSKKIKSTDLAKELGDPANTSTDIILSPALDKPRESLGGADDEDFYESRLPAQAPFAKPLAPKKLNKKVLKTIKKGIPPTPDLCPVLTLASQSKEIRRGVKEVVKALRKGEKGYPPPTRLR